MADPYIPLSVGSELPNLPTATVDVPFDNGTTITELDDGGVEVNLGEADPTEGVEVEHDENLIDYISDQDLMKLASDLIADFDADVRSRHDWESTYIKGLDLMGLKIEERTEPWVNACGVFHPVLAEAVIRFQAETIMEIMPPTGPAKTKIVGRSTEDKIRQAARVENEINHIVINKMTDYRPEKERMLFHLAMAGSAFKKVHFGPIDKRPVSSFVPAEDFVVAYGTTDLRTCPRMTHRMRYYPNEVRRLQATGFWRSDIELPAPVTDMTKIKDKYDKMSGERPTVENDERHTILEMHVSLDLVGFEDEFDLPYVVTIDKSSATILAIRRNWREEDTTRRQRQHFAHYQYLPGVGFYGTGLIHIIGGIAKSATSILRQLVDAGTLSNLPGGLKARGLRIKGEDNPIGPGEFRDVDVTSGSIKDSITFLPYKEPSTVLYQLLGNLVEEGRRIGSIVEMDMSAMTAGAPVGTTLALIERSMKVLSAVQARVHHALGEELKMIAMVVKDYMDDDYEYDTSDDEGTKFVRGDDFDDTISIIPVSDPNASTMAQKVMQYQAALQLAQSAPDLYDLSIIHRQMLEVLNIPNADKIIKSTAAPPAMDPVTENMAVLNNKPAQVYPEQDHDSHLKVHTAFAQDPKYQQFISQNPNGQAVMAALQAHMAEHLAYSYRREMELVIGASLPATNETLPPDVENDIAKLASVGAAKLAANHTAEAAQQKAAAAAQDPLVMIQMEEVRAKAKIADAKELGAITDAYYKANDIAIKQAAADEKTALEALKTFTAMNSTELKKDAPVGNPASPPAPTA